MLKKYFKKIRIYKIPPEVQAKIDAEYNELYQQMRNNLFRLFGDDYKEIYMRWFNADMRQEYCCIRDKHIEEYRQNKARKNQKEREALCNK